MNKNSAATAAPTQNFAFWFHVLLTISAWVGPFLFSWWILVPCYFVILLQFLVFDRCLLNAKHDLGTENDATFYSLLFEMMGFSVNRKVLKFWVRRYVYLILATFTIFWQVVLGFAPLLF